MSHTVRKQFQLGKYLKKICTPLKKMWGTTRSFVGPALVRLPVFYNPHGWGGGGGMNVWTLCVSALWGKKKKGKIRKVFQKFLFKARRRLSRCDHLDRYVEEKKTRLWVKAKAIELVGMDLSPLILVLSFSFLYLVPCQLIGWNERGKEKQKNLSQLEFYTFHTK